MEYIDFLKQKQKAKSFDGIEVNANELNPMLFDWQKQTVKWALSKGRAGLFEDCGLGKTVQQLEWANQVHKHTDRNVLILAPLAVSMQTVREGKKFGVAVNVCRSQADVKPGINITNYEMLDKFNPDSFSGVVLDESSILKSYTGETTQQLILAFQNVPYRLACTATPAPNDYMELGNHVEFLGLMSRTEMLSTFFTHDGGNTSKWRIKGHSESVFWKWCATWGMFIETPADIGYSSDGYVLPPLNIKEVILPSKARKYEMFPEPAKTLDERRDARKCSLPDRVAAAAELVNNSNENWLIWCDYNNESSALKKAVYDCVEVKGDDTLQHKKQSGIDFAEGKIKALVSKSKIYGYGMNWQNCHNVIFCGLSDSYEQYYQSIRRSYRFGQTQPVNVYIIISEREKLVLDNIKRKSESARKMNTRIKEYTSSVNMADLQCTKKESKAYTANVQMKMPKWLNKEDKE